MTTAEKIKVIRATTGLSQVKFSELVGVPVGTLRDWEQGIREPASWVPDALEALVEKMKNGQ